MWSNHVISRSSQQACQCVGARPRGHFQTGRKTGRTQGLLLSVLHGVDSAGTVLGGVVRRAAARAQPLILSLQDN